MPDHSKCVTIPEFNRLTTKFHCKIKGDIADLVKKKNFADKLENLSKKVQDRI